MIASPNRLLFELFTPGTCARARTPAEFGANMGDVTEPLVITGEMPDGPGLLLYRLQFHVREHRRFQPRRDVR